MAKKDLKKQNPDLEINIVDLISKFDPSKTGKYTNFLIKMYRKFLTNGNYNHFEISNNNFGITSDNKFEEFLLTGLYDVFGGSENIRTLHDFNLHLQDNRIPIDKKDITKYDDWSELQKVVSVATLKQKEKLLEKEVIKVMDEQDWLFVRPLTFQASTTYGSSTKWCTASNKNPEYFYKYSDRGVLVYAISRTTGDKYGLFYQNKYSDEREFSIWDATDVRIDSIETTIPSDLLKQIHNYMKNEKNNLYYFSEEEMKKGQHLERVIEVMGEPVPYMMEDIEELTPVENPQNIRVEESPYLTFMEATDVDLTIVKAEDGELPF